LIRERIEGVPYRRSWTDLRLTATGRHPSGADPSSWPWIRERIEGVPYRRS
jgi:hypothetical protein